MLQMFNATNVIRGVDGVCSSIMIAEFPADDAFQIHCVARAVAKGLGHRPRYVRRFVIRSSNSWGSGSSVTVLQGNTASCANSVDCPLSAPCTNRVMTAPANHQENHSTGSVFTQPRSSRDMFGRISCVGPRGHRRHALVASAGLSAQAFDERRKSGSFVRIRAALGLT